MITSFYSYKGGVGRTQLVANAAAYLAHHQKRRVLLMDWDFEAPGLHFYFPKAKIGEKGLIDLLETHITKVENYEFDEEDPRPIFKADDYIVSALKTTEGGTIDLFPAGNYTQNYTQQINQFNWRVFYDKYEGLTFINKLKDTLLMLPYDYIFIDSRTGITDYSGVCNVQLPDINIFVLAPNEQNIRNAADIAERILNTNFVKKNDPFRPIYPVLARVDFSAINTTRVQERATQFAKLFNKILDNTFGIEFPNKKTRTAKIKEYINGSTINYDASLAIGENVIFTNANTATQGILSDISIAAKYAFIGDLLEKNKREWAVKQVKLLKNPEHIAKMNKNFIENLLPVLKTVYTIDMVDFWVNFMLGDSDFETKLLYEDTYFNTCKMFFDENSLEMSRAYSHIGFLYKEKIDYKKAIEYQEKALEIRTKISGETNHNTIRILIFLMNLYALNRNFDKLGAYQERFLSIVMNNEEEKGVMYNYSMMGSLYGYVGNFEKSEYYYKKALNSANEVENLEYHWYIPLILYNLMSISKKLGNKNDETHYQGQLKNIRKNTSDIRSFDTLLSDAVNFERVFFNLPPIAINLDFLNE